jgi:hypothetical protein
LDDFSILLAYLCALSHASASEAAPNALGSIASTFALVRRRTKVAIAAPEEFAVVDGRIDELVIARGQEVGAAALVGPDLGLLLQLLREAKATFLHPLS